MTKNPVHALQALLLLVAGGFALPTVAQDAGPMPPPPATSAPTPASQPAKQKTQDAAAGASGAGTVAAPAPSSGSGTAATDSAAQAANGATSASGTPGSALASAVPAVAPAPKIMVPAGTHIPLVLHNAVSTRSARPGDPVYFETLFPVMIDGKVVIPAGSYVSGEVTESKRPGRVKGRGDQRL